MRKQRGVDVNSTPLPRRTQSKLIQSTGRSSKNGSTLQQRLLPPGPPRSITGVSGSSLLRKSSYSVLSSSTGVRKLPSRAFLIAPSRPSYSSYSAPPAKAYSSPSYGSSAPAYGSHGYSAPSYSNKKYRDNEMEIDSETEVGAAYRGSYGKSPSYSAPSYSAPSYAPAPVYEQQSYSYASPAPPVKCGSNVLIGCAPTVAHVPCGSYSPPSCPSYAPSYGGQSYGPPSYAAPAPQSYSAPSYRSMMDDDDDSESEEE